MSFLSRTFWIISLLVFVLGSSSCHDNGSRDASSGSQSKSAQNQDSSSKGNNNPHNDNPLPNNDSKGGKPDPKEPEPKKTFFTPEQIIQLEPSKIKDVASEQLRLLTPAELQKLTPAQIGALTQEQVQALASQGSRANLRDLTDEQLAAIGVNLSVLNKLTPLEQVNALTAEQFEKLTSIQKIWVYGLIYNLYGHRTEHNPTKRRWTPEEVRALTVEQLSSHKHDFKLLRELFLSISHFSPEQVAAINPVYMTFFWSVPWLSTAQIQALTTEQLDMMSAEQINLMSPSQSQALTEEQKQSLNDKVTRVSAFNVYFLQGLFPSMTLDHVKTLAAHEISNLENKKFGNLEAKAILIHLASLNREQLRAFAPKQMELFTGSDLGSLSTERVADLRPEQISGISPRSFSGFTKNQIPRFTKEQIQTITVKQLDALRWHAEHIDAFTPAQMSSFTPDTISRIDTSWIEKFLTPTHIAELTKEQIQALTIKQLDALRWYSNHIDAITATQMSYFTPDTISRINASWIEKFLTPTHIAELTKAQVQALMVKQLDSLRWYSSHKQALLARSNLLTQAQIKALQ